MNDVPGHKANQLTIQQIRSFCRVFERQSYAAAARDLHLAVPTVWEHLKGVEERYGVRFFVRQGRRIVPSPAAETLHAALLPLLTALDSTFDLVTQPAGPAILTVACGMRMLLEDLGAPLREFHAEFPAVQLRLLHADLHVAQRWVLDGTVDLALVLEPDPKRLHPQVVSSAAYANSYLAVFPKRHPLAKEPRVGLKEVVAHPLILGHTGTSSRQMFDFALHRLGIDRSPQVVMETDNAAFTISCVHAGLGVGIIAGRPGQSLTKGLLTRNLGQELGEGRVIFLWKRGRQFTAMQTQFMDLIRQSVSEAPSSP
ncbi:MAG: LysR family transcriptional regulator [Planctomycetales bacterium]